jgi:hypothetical protein
MKFLKSNINFYFLIKFDFIKFKISDNKINKKILFNLIEKKFQISFYQLKENYEN